MWLSSLSLIACSGSINCSGCLPGGIQDLSNGFSPELKLDQAAQIRLTRSGLDRLETRFADLLSSYQAMSCGGPEDIECPANYNSSCDPVRNVCIDSATGNKLPLIGIEIEREESGGATICRDRLSDPNRRECAAWLKLETLDVNPQPSNLLKARVNARVLTSPLPVRLDSLSMDCIVTLDSEASGAPEQEFNLDITLGEWMSTTATPTRQLTMEVTELSANIATDDLRIEYDPVHGSTSDRLLCAVGNIGAIKNVLVDRLIGELTETIDEALQEALAQTCGGFREPACPENTRCNSSGFCEDDSSGRLIPQFIGLEGRTDLAQSIDGTTGNLDLSFVVGGSSSVDMTGINISTYGGLDFEPIGESCVTATTNPILRPNAVSPLPFPEQDKVDLDWDGIAESDFMVGVGVSQPIVDQIGWMLHESGLLCQELTSKDSSFINTGSLSVLMPSLRQLTRADRVTDSRLLRFATHPARVVLQPTSETRLSIGSGRTSGMASSPVLEEPLLSLDMEGLKIYFSALVNERWVHLMTIQVDLSIPLGVMINPSNEVEFIIGDIDNAVSNVKLENYKILAESEADLIGAIPSLLSLIVPQLTEALELPLALPPAAELGGFELDVLGTRGVEDGQGGYSHLAIYADFDFDKTAVTNVSRQAQTRVRMLGQYLPSSHAMSATLKKEMHRPSVVFELESMSPDGHPLEFQYRIDDQLWSPFFHSSRFEVTSPELLVQGVHEIQFRARLHGRYRSLDPSPSTFEIRIDTEPPELQVQRVTNGVRIWFDDAVSADRTIVEIGVDGAWRATDIRSGDFLNVPELADLERRVEIAAIDEAGLRTELALQTGTNFLEPNRVDTQESVSDHTSSDFSGCVCMRATDPNWLSLGVALSGIAFVMLRRRKR